MPTQPPKPHIEANIPVSVYREGKAFVAYSPVLELATAGKTHAEAKRRFVEALDIFFTETVRKGTLFEVLTELGWQVTATTVTPPVLVSQDTIKTAIPVTHAAT